MSEEREITKFERIWEDLFSFVMFIGAGSLAFGTLWVGLDPPGAATYHDAVSKAGMASIGTVIGAAIMFLKGRK